MWQERTLHVHTHIEVSNNNNDDSNGNDSNNNKKNNNLIPQDGETCRELMTKV
jgi:hypothetical protein